MRAIDVPDYGGDTLFANMYLAYEALSEKMKEMLAPLKAVHSATRIFGSRIQEAREALQHPRDGCEFRRP